MADLSLILYNLYDLAHIVGCDLYDLQRSSICFLGGICAVQILHSILLQQVMS